MILWKIELCYNIGQHHTGAKKRSNRTYMYIENGEIEKRTESVQCMSGTVSTGQVEMKKGGVGIGETDFV